MKLVWPPRLMLKEPPGIVRYLSDDELHALLKAAAQHSLVLHVFIQDDGKPVSKHWISYRWKIIRSNAKLVNFRWHDLRHYLPTLTMSGDLKEASARLGSFRFP